MSIITLFLGKNRFNLRHFYLQCLFQESEVSCCSAQLCHLQCPPALCVPRLSVDPANSLKAGAREEPGFVGVSQEKEPIENSIQWYYFFSTREITAMQTSFGNSDPFLLMSLHSVDQKCLHKNAFYLQNGLFSPPRTLYNSELSPLMPQESHPTV